MQTASTKTTDPRTTIIPPSMMWGCRKHWFALPKTLRDKIWDAYRPGQEVTMTPSREYLEVAQEAQDWIRQQQQKQEGKV